VVVSVGVLHHLDDPAVGVRAVREIVADDGIFLGYLYSRYGRWETAAVRELLDAATGPESLETRAQLVRTLRMSDNHSIRRFASTLSRRMRCGPPLQPLELLAAYRNRNPLVHLSDTYSNPCEQFFTFAEIEALLASEGFEVVGLARGAGLPRTASEHSKDPTVRASLEAMPRAAMYDYFAYHHRFGGFTFVARPR